MIVVKDDFFKSDLSNLIARGTEAYQWCYWCAVPDDATNNKSFVSFLWSEASQDNFFRMLWKLIQKEFIGLRDCDCYRIIANGQVKGQNINWHTDHGDKTALYFPVAWDPKWGGSTYFKIDDTQKEIQYRQNRLVLFNSDISHCGSGPTVDNILRISIAFNLRFKTAG
jgi:2OG-Fe(II) oxygenase superfamily